MDDRTVELSSNGYNLLDLHLVIIFGVQINLHFTFHVEFLWNSQILKENHKTPDNEDKMNLEKFQILKFKLTTTVGFT